MKKSFFHLIVFFLVLLLWSPVNAEDRLLVKDPVLRGQQYAPGEFVVKFRPGTRGQEIAALNARHGTRVTATSPFAGFKTLTVPSGKSVSQMVAVYRRNPNVEYAEPNFIAHAFSLPNDPLYKHQWHLKSINMEPAWAINTGRNAVVAVLDTGVAYQNHSEEITLDGGTTKTVYYAQAPDLASTSFVSGYDFVNNNNHPNDDHGHGTHVAGTIAQSTNNKTGVAGVAYDSSIMPVKVLNSSGYGTYTQIANGIYFSADNGAHIINMSLGGTSSSITLERAVAYAYGKGVTNICAAGNDSSATTLRYPAAYDAYCIAVGATRYDEKVAYYSNRGASLDLTAPGGDNTVDQNGDGYPDGVLQQTHNGSDYTKFNYYFYQGTSMATPHVSGVAALLVSSGVAVTPDQVREVLQSTAKDKGTPGWNSEYGWGIVDAYAALNYTAAPNNAPIAAAGGPYSGIQDIPVTFDGSGSYDPDGDTLTYSWNFGDGGVGSGATPTYTYTAGGNYTVTLVVNDGRADSTVSTAHVSIESVNSPPIADAGEEQTVAVGEEVVLDGSGSWDEGGEIPTFLWEFGDGSPGATGKIVTHTYARSGVYSAQLTVLNSEGLSGTDTTTITVTEEAVDQRMAVDSIDLALSYRNAGRNAFVIAAAAVNVTDLNGTAVSDATVSFSWSGATRGSGTAVTGADGTTVVYSSEVKNPRRGMTFTFTINNVNKDGWSYDGILPISTSVTVP